MPNSYCTPKAWMSRIPAMVASLAFGCSLLSNFWCEMIVFTSTTGETVKFGPWTRLSRNNNGQGEACLVYQGFGSSGFDAAWKTTRAFSVMASIVGGCLCGVTWLSPCFCNISKSWRTFGLLYMLLVTGLQAVTIVFVTSSDKACSHEQNVYLDETFLLFTEDCQWAWGAYVNVLAMVLWFTTGLLMVSSVIPPMELPPPRHKTQTVTYTQSPQPDGTMVITSEVVKGRYVPDEDNNVNAPKV